MVTKFNDEKKKQERVLLITNKYIYNIKLRSIIWNSAVVRRKILISKLAGITISRMGFEFVIHVYDDYDYRYMSLEK